MAITLNDIKKMPAKTKVLAVCLFFFLIGYLYWFYFLSSAIEKKSALNEKYTELQTKIKEKEKVAMQINQYMADVAKLTENYKVALLKLPNQKEIPALFHSVALAGKDAGVEFLLFEPKAPVPKVLEKPPTGVEKTVSLLKPSDQRQSEQKPAGTVDENGKKVVAPAPEPFYEEIPVGVSVIGTFQNVLYFFNKVAQLPRIINVSDISIGDRKELKGRGNVVTTSCTIKTYMFIDKKEKLSEKTK
jgi:type IV pilus assembly protein PilO